MVKPYIGEIRMFAGDFAPAGWRICDGSLLPISESAALFDLIGTTYGGDGKNTFAVPDLRGRVPISRSDEFRVGESGGAEVVALTRQQMPAHGHGLLGTSTFGEAGTPLANTVGRIATGFAYIDSDPISTMAETAVGSTGRSRPHGNLQPYLCVDFIISLYGIFPTQA